ncbi:hypothetical protein EDD18DRAFT_1348552 [Armillaria luteobubalina]|uniref:Uncharacterized protein n=1 Tax=Armillaria luteobubalina TaxID=153913 RepID=A0AA39QF09_9AGAR|nr:hypothetical protein IW262DRAFT_1468528 [Armillaria fumosa]KAK0501084.1 hypothetical protein EDD18DRAFT_1348552 [Armillaria luteobubalina]
MPSDPSLTILACRSSLKSVKRTPHSSSTSEERVAAAPIFDGDGWFFPVDSSPCPPSSKLGKVSCCGVSSPVAMSDSRPSGSRIPQPFSDLPPFDEPDWPHLPPAQTIHSAKKSSITVVVESPTIVTARPAPTSMKIICWLEVRPIPETYRVLHSLGNH